MYLCIHKGLKRHRKNGFFFLSLRREQRQLEDFFFIAAPAWREEDKHKFRKTKDNFSSQKHSKI
jgi:hypothetical protein